MLRYVSAVRSVLRRAARASRLAALRFAAVVGWGAKMVNVATVATAVGCLVCVVMLAGFDHSAATAASLRRALGWCRLVFLIDIAYGVFMWLARRSRGRGLGQGESRATRFTRLAIQALVVVTAVPLVWPRPVHPWLPWLASLVYSRAFVTVVLTAYSLIEVSYAATRLPSRRTNPSMLLALSFITIIALGTLLLLMPKATYDGISVDNALFVATSAVCITGLTPVDIPATFTPLGLFILAVLIQVGGLGVLTFTYFFALFFSGHTSIFSQLLVRDVVYSRSIEGLLPMMLYILGFTLCIEGAGAVALWLTLPQGIVEGGGPGLWWTAVFHSISAFCNAGFSTIPEGYSNVMLLRGSQWPYWVTSLIVIFGAVGFPLLANARDWAAEWLRRRRGAPVRRVFDMNSRLVAVVFFVLFAIGAAAFLVLEWDNTLRGMDLWEKVSQAVFNSTTPRSSGFVSVNPARFLAPTLLMVMVLMWIGGAAQSTAGGIKVNTLGAVLLHLRAIVRGQAGATAFGRRISLLSVRRANAVVVVSVLSYAVIAMALLLLEPALSPKALLFEGASALFTVGSSLGVTSQLGTLSKILLCVAMLLGRVGIISIFMGMARRPRHDVSVHLPAENIIIN